MTNTVYYGADSELRIGIRADKDTAPTAWHNVEFNQLTINPIVERKRRPRLGAARQNKLDQLKPRKGLKNVSWDVTLDADTLMLGRWLRAGLGAPATTGSSAPYTHLWVSGAKTEIYFDIAVRRGSEKVMHVIAASIGPISTDFTGETSQDFDIQLSGMSLDSARLSDWPSGTVTGATTPAPILRAAVLFDGTAADQVVGGGFTFDRNLQGDFYAATGAGNNLASYLRPGPQPVHSARATIRAHGSAFEDLAEAGTEFSAEIRYIGVTSGHRLSLVHPQADMADIPDSTGEREFERALNWTAHQDSDTPALQISLLNSVATY